MEESGGDDGEKIEIKSETSFRQCRRRVILRIARFYTRFYYLSFKMSEKCLTTNGG